MNNIIISDFYIISPKVILLNLGIKVYFIIYHKIIITLINFGIALNLLVELNSNARANNNEMPVFSEDGSIKAIDDIVVIKFTE